SPGDFVYEQAEHYVSEGDRIVSPHRLWDNAPQRCDGAFPGTDVLLRPVRVKAVERPSHNHALPVEGPLDLINLKGNPGVVRGCGGLDPLGGAEIDPFSDVGVVDRLNPH